MRPICRSGKTSQRLDIGLTAAVIHVLGDLDVELVKQVKDWILVSHSHIYMRPICRTGKTCQSLDIGLTAAVTYEN